MLIHSRIHLSLCLIFLVPNFDVGWCWLVGWLADDGWWLHLHGVSMCSRCFSNYPSWWSFLVYLMVASSCKCVIISQLSGNSTSVPHGWWYSWSHLCVFTWKTVLSSDILMINLPVYNSWWFESSCYLSVRILSSTIIHIFFHIYHDVNIYQLSISSSIYLSSAFSTSFHHQRQVVSPISGTALAMSAICTASSRVGARTKASGVFTAFGDLGTTNNYDIKCNGIL